MAKKTKRLRPGKINPSKPQGAKKTIKWYHTLNTPKTIYDSLWVFGLSNAVLFILLIKNALVRYDMVWGALLLGGLPLTLLFKRWNWHKQAYPEKLNLVDYFNAVVCLGFPLGVLYMGFNKYTSNHTEEVNVAIERKYEKSTSRGSGRKSPAVEIKYGALSKELVFARTQKQEVAEADYIHLVVIKGSLGIDIIKSATPESEMPF